MTVGEAVGEGARRLAAARVDAASWDAERLLSFVLGSDRAGILASGSDSLKPADEERYFRLVSERARRRPLQHLIGTQPFFHHDFLVGPDVLIPRGETEILVEAALEAAKARPSPIVVDVGTGSGCIALSVAAARPDAEVHATDVSPAALAVARENARHLGLGERIHFHEGDLLGPVRDLRFDLVLSNPPYVEADEWSRLEPEVRDHEPRLALVPQGGDVLALYRRLFEEASLLLVPKGVLVVEVGLGMAEAVVSLLSRFEDIVVKADLQNIPRTVVARLA